MMTMHLSQLTLNQRSRSVRRDLSDCEQMHRTVMSAFPVVGADRGVRASLGVLYRVDASPSSGAVTLLVQSRERSDWSRLPADYLAAGSSAGPSLLCKSVDDAFASIREDLRLRFRLRANPTRKIDTKTGSDGKRRHGRRVELRSDEERLAWLRRKGADGGFRLLSIQASPEVPDVRSVEERRVRGARAGAESEKVTLAPVLFEGVLDVTDREAFVGVLVSGIGPGKAYGFGLLSVARAGSWE